MNVLDQLRLCGRGMAPKEPPIPVQLGSLGLIGHTEHRRGLYINSAIERHVLAALRDEERAEIAAREATNGRLGAGDILPVLRLGTDHVDAIRIIKSATASLATWDDFIAAKLAGKSMELPLLKVDTGTLAGRWHHLGSGVGNFGFSWNSFSNIPGGDRLSEAYTGALKLPMQMGASEHLYLTNLGIGRPFSGANESLCLLVDLLVGATNINNQITTSQDINLTSLPRWTGGVGVKASITYNGNMATKTFTLNYTNEAGTTGQSASGSITGGANGFDPTGPDGVPPWFQLSGGDTGMRSVETITLSAAGNTLNTLSIMLYKPLLWSRQLQTVDAFRERSAPLTLGKALRLTSVSGGGSPNMPCLSLLGLYQSTATASISVLFDFFWG